LPVGHQLAVLCEAFERFLLEHDVVAVDVVEQPRARQTKNAPFYPAPPVCGFSLNSGIGVAVDLEVSEPGGGPARPGQRASRPWERVERQQLLQVDVAPRRHPR